MVRCVVGFVGVPRSGVYERACYVGRSGGEFESSFSLVAVAADLGCDDPAWTPDRIVILSTATGNRLAGQWLPREFERRGIEAERQQIDIPEGSDEVEIQRTAEAIRDAIPAGAEVVLDISHAFRHLPMIALSVLSVLRVTKRVHVHAVRYASLEARDELDRPRILDLTWAMEASEMAFAARALLEMGEGGPLAAYLEQQDTDAPPDAAKLGPAADAIRRQVGLLGYGLALDAIKGATIRLSDAQRARLDARSKLLAPVVETAVESIRAVASIPTRWPRDGKPGLALSRDVLDQQARVVDWLLASGRIPAALTLAREWVVNRILLARGRAAPREWLRKSERLDDGDAVLGRYLTDVAAGRRPPTELAAVLSPLTQRRNALDHAGHSLDVVNAFEAADVRMHWDTLRRLDTELSDVEWRLDPPEGRPHPKET